MVSKISLLSRRISRRAVVVGAVPAALAFVPMRLECSPGPQAGGGEDDTAALNRALARGGTVQLEGRAYRTTAPLEVPAGATLIGSTGSVIMPDGNFSAIRTSGSDVAIRGLAVRGDRTRHRSSGNHGIFIDWRERPGTGVRIDGVTVEDVAGSAIIALASAQTRSSGLSVTQCRTAHSGAHGIIAQDYVDDVVFERNSVEASGLMVPDRPGITASRYGRRILVRNNNCVGHPAALGNSVHGISIDICEDATCIDNNVSGWTQGYGIEAGGIAGGQIASNRISGGRYGIGLSGVVGGHRNRDLLVSDNVIENMAAAGIFAFMHGADGRTLHERITLRANEVTRVSGPDIGIGVFLMDIDRLTIDGLSVSGCAKSGVAIMDCPNHRLQRIRSYANNATGDLAHAGLAIHWRRIPPARRGSNETSGNRIERNGAGRDVATYEH